MVRSTVVIVDNVDVDNSVAAVAACNSSLKLNVEAVIVTGRFAHSDPDAPIETYDQAHSVQILRRNTRRLKGLLQRAGWDIPVFEGLIPPATIVPHHVHIDEKDLDLYNDARYTCDDGPFVHALDYLCELEGTIDFIVGGPLTEIAQIMREPRLQGRLGTITCQLGLFNLGDIQTMAGEGRTFNSAADPVATHELLFSWPGEVYLVPTDITKTPPVGFDTPSDLYGINMNDELVRLYEIFWQEVLMPRAERIYPHDVHPVFLMAQLHRTTGCQLYAWDEVRIESVNEQGVIDAVFHQKADGPLRRFVVTGVASQVFMRLLSATTR